MAKKISERIRTSARNHYDDIAAGRCPNDYTDHFYAHFGMRSNDYSHQLDLSQGYENKLHAARCNGVRLC